MKEALLNSTINNIKKHYNYSDTKLLEIKYGLDTLYLTIVKTIVIIITNYFTHTLKIMLLISLFYGLLRITGFGLHAKKSWQCWIASLLVFSIMPIMLKFYLLPKVYALIISCICLILLSIYAPADTQKRPLINKKKRTIYKVSTISIATAYIIYMILSKSVQISNILMFSMILESFVVTPFAYKLFGLRYKNYLNYKKGGNS